MLFEKKTKAAMEAARKRNEERFPPQPEKPEVKPEKGDLPAMMCSAYLILLPVCILVLILLCAAGYFFILR